MAIFILQNRGKFHCIFSLKSVEDQYDNNVMLKKKGRKTYIGIDLQSESEKSITFWVIFNEK